MMARMPIDPRLARMIVGGAHFGVLKEILVVVSAPRSSRPRERPADKQMQADQKACTIQRGRFRFSVLFKTLGYFKS